MNQAIARKGAADSDL
jgi:ATP-binding cassette, subfamily A (ABC1), member 3